MTVWSDMYGEKQENVYYYITTLNENYHMPAMPEGAEEGIRKGIYKLETIEGSKGKVQLLGSGSILRHVREAAEILAKDYGVGSDVYSVTSFTELARDGQDCERWNMLHPLETPRVPYIAQVMNDAPAVASTDYMKLFAEQVRTYVPADDYTDPAPATTFAHLDATTELSRDIASRGLYPAVDPLASTSRILDPTYVGEEHYQVATKVKSILQKNKELQDIIAILAWMSFPKRTSSP